MPPALIAIVCIALGLSFAWKCIQAVFLGRVLYWSGFLPISIISPLFTHLPPGKNSLVKTYQSWWIHITAGPAFLFISLILLASGADQIGLPGTQAMNHILTLGRDDAPPAVTYSRDRGYTFHLFHHASDHVYKAITQPVFEDHDKLVKTADPQAK